MEPAENREQGLKNPTGRSSGSTGGSKVIGTAFRLYSGLGGGAFAATVFALALLSLFSATASAAEPPTVAIDANPTVDVTQVHVAGSVESTEEAVTVFLQYASEPGSWENLFVEEIEPESGRHSISATAIGLRGATEYEFRLDAVTNSGEFFSPEPNPKATTATVAKPSISIEAPSAVTTRTATFSGHVTPNSPKSESETSPAEQEAYGTGWSFGCVSVGCPGPSGFLAADSSAHEVTGEVEGLEPGTTYELLLEGHNAGGTETSSIETFTTPAAPPTVSSTVYKAISASGFGLEAVVNPEGATTAVYFQVVTAQQFAMSEFADSVDTATQELGAGNEGVPVTASVSDLAPATSYRVRAIVSNEAGGGEGQVISPLTLSVNPLSPAGGCPNEAFRTGPSALLPDCRAYEQASPVDKNGGSLEGAIGQVKAAEDGSAVTFFSQAGIPGGVGSQEFPTFMASRGASDWSTRGVLPPQGLGDEAHVRGFSSNLRYVATEVAITGTGSGPSTREAALLLEDTLSHTLTTIVPYTETEAEEGAYVLAGVSDDGNQVFFEAKVPLGSGAPAGQQNLFVWNRATGAVSPIGILPSDEGGELATEGSYAGPYRWYEENLEHGGAFDNFYVAEEHAISDNGEMAYFTTRGTGEPAPPEAGQLYLRRGLTGNAPSTVRVSRSQKTNGTGEDGKDPFDPQPASFLMATSDGSRAFFMSREELTNDANTGSADQGNDLYVYDADSERLTDLTAAEDSETETSNGAEVIGALGISEDGSVIYFVANGVLAPGAKPGNCGVTAEGGMCNIYRRSEIGGRSQITFVTQIEGSTKPRRGLTGDARNWSPASVRTETLSAFLEPTSRVSADGETLLFRTFQSLTGYANQGCEEDGEVGSRGRCPEFYRYSAATGQTVCVSCSPTGAPPVGLPSLRSRTLYVFAGGGVTGTLATQSRNLSRDGDQIFFETPDALVPEDVNGEGGCRFTASSGNPPENSCEDVYEWEAEGSGSCTVATVPGGCLYLISSGQSQTSSNIADIDASGENVFFFTESQLVPTDSDHLIDIYDARVNGGLASQHPQSVSECTGEACQANSMASPAVSQPGSSSFVGPSNPPAKHEKKKHQKSKRKSTKKKNDGRKRGPHHSPTAHRKKSARGNRGGAR